jgi:hypothetical protein
VSDIRVGDLVMIVRSCCASASVYEGHVYSVVGFSSRGTIHNSGNNPCGYSGSETVAILDGHSVTWGRPLSWLKRIPPLDELERDQIVKELSV